MGKVKTLIRLLKENPQEIRKSLSDNLAKQPLSHLLSDKFYLKRRYRSLIGKRLNLKDPKTFNEKLQWLKLYDRQPEYVTMVDKHEVKRYVSDIIGEQYIIPTLAIWDTVEEIIGHEPGGVCPFALNENVKVYLDVSLKRFSVVHAAAGAIQATATMTVPELEKYSCCHEWIDVCELIEKQ